MSGHSSSLSHVEKLTRLNGPKWLMQAEHLLEGQGLTGLVHYPHVSQTGWLYAPSRSIGALDSSGTLDLPVSDHGPSIWQRLDEEERTLRATLAGGASSVTQTRALPAGGEVSSRTAGGLGEGGAESSKATARRVQPLPGELLADGLNMNLENLRAAAELPLPDDSEHLFLKLVSSLIATDPKRAIALMSVPESKSLVDRPAKLARAAAMLKMTISDALLPQFRNLTTPQQIFDEVYGWEVSSRRTNVPLIRGQLLTLRMSASERPTDYFYRAKGYVEELALAGIESKEWESVGQMLAGVTHDRFQYVRGLFADMPEENLKFLDVLDRFNKSESNNMLLPSNSPFYPPYLRINKTPAPSPAFAADIFPPAGGRGSGGRGAPGRGRSGRGRGDFGGAKGQLLCTHCGKVGHLIATCFKLHPHLAPGSSRPRSDQTKSPVNSAEYKALLALFMAQQQS